MAQRGGLPPYPFNGTFRKTRTATLIARAGCSLIAQRTLNSPTTIMISCDETIEHAFRFARVSLGWTTVRPRHPAAADRWTWLVAAVFWQLWLASPLVADQRLPWDRPLPAARLTPGSVHQAFTGLLATLGTPAQPPQRRGNSPGRRPGQRTGPRQRFAVVRRPPAKATRRRRTRRRSPRAA